MPMKTQVWDAQLKRGNPTRSVKLNELVKKLKKLEVCCVGVASKAVRQLEESEWEQMIQIFSESNNDEVKYAFTSFMKTQFHLSARLDDTAHMFINNYKVHNKYDFTIIGRCWWSKNLQEECNAPDQVCLDLTIPHIVFYLELRHIWIIFDLVLVNNLTYCIIFVLAQPQQKLHFTKR